MVKKLPISGRWLLFLLWVGVAAFTTAQHEPWRDEVHSWTIARMSDSPGEVIKARAYEGHPSLWYLMLWGITRVSETPAGMQALHLLIAAGSMALLFWKAPFSLTEKALLAFGYFFLFEYTVLARNYAPGILFVFLFCTLFPLRKKSWGWMLLTLLLFPLMESSIYGILTGIALFGFLFLERIFARKEEKTSGAFLMGGSLIFALALLLSVLDILPPANSGVGTKWHLTPSYEGVAYALSTAWDAFLPLPRLQLNFWNSNFLYFENEALMLGLKAAGALALLFVATRFWLRTPLIRILFLLGCGLYLAFLYSKYHGFLRHHGHFFVLLVACRWLEGQFPKVEIQASSFERILRGPAFTVLLAIQLLAGLIACQYDWRFSFSGAEAATAYLRTNGLEQRPMLGDPDFVAGGISGRLGRAIYFPMTEGEGIYPVWDQSRRWRPPQEVWRAAKALQKRSGQSVILVLNYPLEEKVDAPQLKLLQSFTGNIEASEDIFLYELQ